MSDEASETKAKRRRRRRSLRVPVDEVPRPTQSAERVLQPEEIALARSVEVSLDEPVEDEPATDAAEELTGEDPRSTTEVPEEMLVQSAPSAPSTEPEMDAMAAEAPLVSEESDAVDDRTTLEDIDAAAGAQNTGTEQASVEVDLDGELGEDLAGESSDAAADDVQSETSADEPAAEAAGDPAPEKAVEAVSVAATVVVQRVVSVVSAPGSVPPPPPPPDLDPEDEEELEVVDVVDTDTEPGTEVSVDVDLYDDAEEELDDGEIIASGDEIDERRPSKPPPPPTAGPKVSAPPPPPEKAKPVVAPLAAVAPQPVRKKPRKKWWEALFSDDYLRTVPIPHPKTIVRQCDFIAARLGLPAGSTILDVGCGLGLHAVELTRRGYLVVGLDLSLPMLSRAADEAQAEGFKINFLHADMREMNFDGAFDAVMCWGTTFGYFDDEQNKLIIERLYKALKPRGLLLLDVVNRDHVIRTQPNLVWFEGDGCVVMEETQMNYINSRLNVKRTVILDDGRQKDSIYSLRLYALHELGMHLHQQGFRVVEISGREAHPGVFFGADSPQLIVLAERRPEKKASSKSNGSTAAVVEAPSAEQVAAPAPPSPPSANAPPQSQAEATEAPSSDVSEALADVMGQDEETELEPEELEPEELVEETPSEAPTADEPQDKES